MQRYQWFDSETVFEESAPELRFVLPRGVSTLEEGDNYRVEVWSARHGYLGAVSTKTLGRIFGRARRYQRFVLEEEPELEEGETP